MAFAAGRKTESRVRETESRAEPTSAGSSVIRSAPWD